MPLESCMILLDSSPYMRNGDYVPTRLEAQQDAANLLVGTKTQAHPESTVGIGAGTNVLCSPTEDVGKILSAVHGLSLSNIQHSTSAAPSASDGVTAAVQVASLALKHRKNKNGSQRIVLFCGSPVHADNKTLQKAGRQLKKNNVAIDVVCLGELEHNEPKLKELVDAANGRSGTNASSSGGDNAENNNAERTCHLVTIPAGVLPSDVLASSPIVGGAGGAFAASAAAAAMNQGGGAGGGAGAGGAGAVDAFAEFGGVDPNMDPELAMALRISMEEERARQERAAAAAAAENSGNNNDAAAGGGDSEMADASSAAAVASNNNDNDADDMGLSEEEALLQQALAMSMNENEPAASSSTGNNEGEKEEEEAKAPATAAAAAMDVDEDDDAAMQMALQMSMAAQDDGDDNKKEEGFQDPAFVSQLLGQEGGVDANDPEIQEALRKSKEEEDDKKKKKSGGDDDDKKE